MLNLLSIYTKSSPLFNRIFIYKLSFFLILFSLLGISGARAQQNNKYTLYSNIIYRLTKYINWPDDKKMGDFVIGVVGDSPLYDEIKKFTVNKTVGNQRIIIRSFVASAESYNCHVLFICENESRSVKRIAAFTQRMPVLLLTEAGGLAQKGSCINFIIDDDHLKLEINKNNIEQRHFDIASELLSLGVIVK